MNHAFIDTAHETGAGEESPLYEQDFQRWLEAQAAHLRARQFALLDLENLVEEIETMAGNQRRELKHRLETLMMHSLKCQFQPHRKSGSWLRAVTEQRFAIDEMLKQSPSLRRKLEAMASAAYPKARRLAADETMMPIKTFPPEMPFSIGQIQDEDFVP
ncbi:MAG: DUF29 domain-containing protein [Massilia sp.]